jgi:hypothetical protein
VKSSPWAGGLLALALVLAGCARLSPVLEPAPWDEYPNSGPLAVRGAKPDAPGPTIVRALRREPSLTALFEGHGEPDEIEVLGGRYQPKDVALVYKRTGRRIVVESTSSGWVARAPETLPGHRRTTRQVRAPQAPRPGPPTTAQTLECPIDPTRADCVSLCASAKYEWCP